jgi:hypothetical protein
MLEASLARGHWRVAVRRYAMLTASGQPISRDLRARCVKLAGRMTSRELAQVFADARNWAAFAGVPLGNGPSKHLGNQFSRLSQIQDGRWKVVSD